MDTEYPDSRATDKPRPPPHRQRDKPQLSCDTCRRLKRRCDRQRPCGLCRARRTASSCSFPSSSDSERLSGAPSVRMQLQSPEEVGQLVDEIEYLTLQLQIPASEADKMVAILAKLARLKSHLRQPGYARDGVEQLTHDDSNVTRSPGADTNQTMQPTMPSSNNLDDSEESSTPWTRHSYAPFSHLLYSAPDSQGPSMGLLH